MKCKICSAPARLFGRATVLNRCLVQYFQCERCGFIQTETPYWLDEAYAEAITRSDLGLIRRNVTFARITPVVLLAFFNRRAQFLDYGGGYGIFVRLMRDNGFDFYRADKFCTNLFAAGFDVTDNPNTRYEMVTAFEVFEHLGEPLEEIASMLTFSRSLLFSTLLVPSPAPDLNRWWYYGLDHGQHLAFYTRQTLNWLARHFGLHVYSDGRSLHLLTDKRLSNMAFTVASLVGRVAPWLGYVLTGELRRRSWLPDDYYALTGKRLT